MGGRVCAPIDSLGRLSVSRLVCAAFHGPQPSPEEGYVLHGEDGPLDNKPGNLRWGTQEENLADPRYRARQREAWVRRKARRDPDYLSAKDRAKVEHAAAVLRRLSP
ncbi:MAG: HNH endonuclease, partial [Spirochaetia bacterium]|nr:HNH endonuclease [Spirochaetia bacterium]